MNRYIIIVNIFVFSFFDIIYTEEEKRNAIESPIDNRFFL